jgi:hypothetical protein
LSVLSLTTLIVVMSHGIGIDEIMQRSLTRRAVSCFSDRLPQHTSLIDNTQPKPCRNEITMAS